MSAEESTKKQLPIACTLTPEDLAATRDALLPGLMAQADLEEPLADGMRWRFRTRPGLVAQLAAVIENERRCCRFLRFALAAEPGEGAVWLEVTGPAGTREFLSSVLRSNDR